MVKTASEHTHRFLFPPAAGRRILPGQCACGAKRKGFAIWDDEGLPKSRHTATPDRPVPLRASPGAWALK